MQVTGSREDFTEEETEMRGFPWRTEDRECGTSKQHKNRRTEGYSSNRRELYREKWTRDFQKLESSEEQRYQHIFSKEGTY